MRISDWSSDVCSSDLIGLCAESHCKFVDSLAFPDAVDAGLRVAHLGRSSVRYEIGLFGENKDAPAAEGWFVHVFVDRETRRPVALDEIGRAACRARVCQYV